MTDENEKTRLLRILRYQATHGEDVDNHVDLVRTDDLMASLFFVLEAAKKQHGNEALYRALGDYLRVEVSLGAHCREQYVADGGTFEPSRVARANLVSQSLGRAGFFLLRAAEDYQEKTDA